MVTATKKEYYEEFQKHLCFVSEHMHRLFPQNFKKKSTFNYIKVANGSAEEI